MRLKSSLIGWALGAIAAAAGLLAIGAPAALAASPCGTSGVYSTSGTTATCTYTTAGTEDTFTVPAGVSSLDVTAVGAPGGSGAGNGGAVGGMGAQVTDAALPVPPSSTELWVDVGAPGETGAPSAGGAFDGGTGGLGVTNFGGGGGGSSALLTVPRQSAVLTGNPANDSRLLVAGGGGGGGAGYGYPGGSAGDAGVTGAGAGGAPCLPFSGGNGGVGGPGGLGGGEGAMQPCNGGFTDGTSGTAVAGGEGGHLAGGGGGGWFGGGGGGGLSSGLGGGGGSSYGPAGTTYATASSTQAPEVVISWTVMISPKLSSAVEDASTGAGWLGYEIPGAMAYDTASLTGLAAGQTPTGAVTYSLYDNSGCSGTAASTQTVSLNADGSIPNSAKTAPLAQGGYSYEASYSGAGIYNPALGGCRAEPVGGRAGPSASRYAAAKLAAARATRAAEGHVMDYNASKEANARAFRALGVV